MPQNEYMDLHRKRYGRRLDHEERLRKREAREPKKRALMAKKTLGLKAKLLHKKNHVEKATMRKKLRINEESKAEHKSDDNAHKDALPTYLLDREKVSRAKVLSNSIKQKRKERAGKWDVPIPKVAPNSEAEIFKVVKSGKRQKKAWKRMVSQPTFVGEGFTRKNPKAERFIRPMALRMKKAHVTHPELKATFMLDILGVKKNPNGALYTSLGVITRGTIIEVNVSDLGLVTPTGKVVWGKYAQCTNNPSLDGVVNAVLLV